MNKENLEAEARKTLEDLSIPPEKRDTSVLLDILCPKRKKLNDLEILIADDEARWN